ncbi:MAG: right-handed parallel beta-helix repeat-containing protein [Candidatus Krumholzibacteria bacterium]
MLPKLCCRLGLSFLLAFFILPLSIQATVLTVRQDGSGDFLTITDAVTAAVSGDTVEVGPGTYPEEVDIFIRLVFTSTNGPAVTIVDGQDTRHHLWFLGGGPGSEVNGFKFINGFNPSGGGSIRVQGGATLTIQNCDFENNSSAFDGAALFARDFGSELHVENSTFTGNHATHNGGAGNAILGARLTVTDCTFLQNSSGEVSAGLGCNDSSMDVIGCVFTGNVSADLAGAIHYFRSTGLVANNTFHENTSPGPNAGTVVMQQSTGTTVSRNIFSGDTAGPGISYVEGSGSHSCNVFWGNADGPIRGGALAGDEVVADPVFCRAAAGDFTISTHSPASAANSACGLLIGALPEACSIEPPSAAPAIISILDIPNDNGRQVRIKWAKSSHDASGQPFVITEYGIYRFQGLLAAPRVPPTDLPRSRSVTIDGWDFIATVPARGDDVYQFVAPTLCDSTIADGMCWSVFFVSAMTPDPLVFFDSPPDSGYSVDNVPPQMPQGLSVTLQATGNLLAWDSSPDADFDVFNIYRGPTENFTPGAATLVNSLPENQWTDPVANTTPHFYKISAVDDAGNESEAASPETVVGIATLAIPTTYRLHQNAPNPFNPSTIIRYDVPRGGGHVTLQIFDVSGRLVRTVFNRFESAGTGKSVVWDARANNGQRVSSGVYFYRLTAAGFAETRKMTLLE